jgi:hypothetical protein
LIIRRTDFDVGCDVPLYQIIGLTDDPDAIHRFKNDHPEFVPVCIDFICLVFYLIMVW